jgi:hypothetical protein
MITDHPVVVVSQEERLFVHPKSRRICNGFSHAFDQGLREVPAIRPVIRHGLADADGAAGKLKRILVMAFFQQDHRLCDRVDSGDVGTPLMELHSILFAPGVLLYELNQAENVRPVAFDARPVLEPKKKDQAVMIRYALME